MVKNRLGLRMPGVAARVTRKAKRALSEISYKLIVSFSTRVIRWNTRAGGGRIYRVVGRIATPQRGSSFRPKRKTANRDELAANASRPIFIVGVGVSFLINFQRFELYFSTFRLVLNENIPILIRIHENLFFKVSKLYSSCR